jgi:multicomponent K+:H+ antiporter subunit G
MSQFADLAMTVLLAVGCFFVLVGSFGLVKLSEFFKRLHGPTKATTLGVGCILIASIIYHAVLGDGLGLREILITLFLFITAPISAHLMARAALTIDPDQRPPQPEADQAVLHEAPDEAPPAPAQRASHMPLPPRDAG